MTHDYDDYQLKGREKICFLAVGYVSMAFMGYLFYRNIILSLCAGVAVLLIKPYYQSTKARKRKELLMKQFRDLLYSLSGSIATGRSMPDALEEGRGYLSTIYGRDTPMICELDAIVTGIREKKEDEAMLLISLGIRSKCSDIADFAQVYAISRSTGGDMEKVIRRAVSIISDKMAIEAEIRAMTAQKKTESRIIALMPIVVIAGLNIMSPDYIGVLYTTFVGRVIMTVCLGAIAASYCMIEKITRIEV